MTPESRIAAGFCKGLIAAVMAGLVIAAISHDLELLRASRSKTGPYPQMIYTPLATPGTGAAGADFVDIYMSAQALRHGESAYKPTTPAFADPFGRLKNYPALMYWLYVPLTLLPFWPALVVHSVASLLALFGATVFMLRKACLDRHIGLVLLAQAGLFFLTPIGATHFERGQFDLLVAAMIALCFACTFVNRGIFVLAIATGMAGAVKWTSVPFLGCFSAFGFLLSSGRRRWAFFVLPCLTLLSTVVFWGSLHEYWESIRFFELNVRPSGLSLRYLLPRLPARLLPVALTLGLAILVWARAGSASERSRLLGDVGAPFAVVLTNLAICYPTFSYEYHTVTALGMLPALVVWTEKATHVPVWVKAVTCALYAVLLIVAFRLLDQLVVLSPRTMSIIYVVFSALFLAICVHVVLAHKRNVATGA
jgi:Glycosyltransferase family 87